jgi:hypothetical protein
VQESEQGRVGGFNGVKRAKIEGKMPKRVVFLEARSCAFIFSDVGESDDDVFLELKRGE